MQQAAPPASEAQAALRECIVRPESGRRRDDGALRPSTRHSGSCRGRRRQVQCRQCRQREGGFQQPRGPRSNNWDLGWAVGGTASWGQAGSTASAVPLLPTCRHGCCGRAGPGIAMAG